MNMLSYVESLGVVQGRIYMGALWAIVPEPPVRARVETDALQNYFDKFSFIKWNIFTFLLNIPNILLNIPK